MLYYIPTCRALERQMKNKQTVVSCLHTNAMTRGEPRIWASRETYSIYTQCATEGDGGIASTYTLHNKVQHL